MSVFKRKPPTSADPLDQAVAEFNALMPPTGVHTAYQRNHLHDRKYVQNENCPTWCVYYDMDGHKKAIAKDRELTEVAGNLRWVAEASLKRRAGATPEEQIDVATQLVDTTKLAIILSARYRALTWENNGDLVTHTKQVNVMERALIAMTRQMNAWEVSEKAMLVGGEDALGELLEKVSRNTNLANEITKFRQELLKNSTPQ